MKLTTAIMALAMTVATAAHADSLSIDVGSGKDKAKKEDFYSVKLKDSFALPGAFSLVTEGTINSGKTSGATTGRAKLGVGHDILAYGPLTVNAVANITETFGTTGRDTGWSVEPGAAVKAGPAVVGVSYEYGKPFNDSVNKLGEVKTTKVGVAMPVAKHSTLGLRYEQARGDWNKNTVYAGFSTKF